MAEADGLASLRFLSHTFAPLVVKEDAKVSFEVDEAIKKDLMDELNQMKHSLNVAGWAALPLEAVLRVEIGRAHV